MFTEEVLTSILRGGAFLYVEKDGEVLKFKGTELQISIERYLNWFPKYHLEGVSLDGKHTLKLDGVVSVK